MNLMAAIGQILDYVFKAVKAYADTPEGAKEFNDIIDALEVADTGAEARQATQSGVVKSYRGG